MKYHLLENEDSNLANYLKLLGVEFTCISKLDRIEDYIDRIVSKVSFSPDDTLIIDAHSTFETENKNDYAGFEILKWLRISEFLLNPIIVIGIEKISSLLQRNPEDYIILAPAVHYLELPISKELWNRTNLKKIESIDSLKEKYKLFVQADFQTLDITHSLANEFGMFLLNKGLSQINIKQFDFGSWPLAFAKAEFLYEYNIENINSCQNKIYYRNRRIIEEFEGNIVYLDDQGDEGWFEIIRNTLGAKENNFIPINPVIRNGDIQIDLTANQIISKNPSIVLVDLRLQGDKEKNEEVRELTGSHLIKSVRIKNPSVPILLLSASDKLITMETLSKYPYLVDGFWTKPRVEKGDLNISSLILELSKKVTYLLTHSEGFNLAKEAKYKLEKSRHSNDYLDFPKFYDDIDFFLFDTCFLEEVEGLLELDRLVNKFPGKVVVVSDVWSELELNSRKRECVNEKYYLKVVLEVLKRFDDSRLLAETRKDEEYVQNSEIEVNSVIHGDGFLVNKERTILHSYASSKNEKEKIERELKQELLDKNIKSLIHADDVFRLLIKNYIFLKKKKVILFSNDLTCKQNVLKELQAVKKSLTFENLEEKALKAHAIQRNTFKQSVVIKDGERSVCYLVQNKDLPK